MDQPRFPGEPPYHPAYGTGVQQPWTVPPPAGLPYHRLARTPLHRWWRPVLGTLLVGGGFVAAGLVVFVIAAIIARFAGIPILLTGGSLFGDPLYSLTVTLVSLAVVLPITYLAAMLTQRRPPGTLSSVAGRVRWRWLWTCTAAAVVAVLAGWVTLTVLMAITGEDVGGLFGWVGWGEFLPALVVVLLLVPFQAAAEEYVFRGWLLQAFGAYLRTPWPGVVLGAAAFTAMHAYTGWGILDVFAFGVFMGWISVRTGGLEAAIGIHTVNNVLAFLAAAAAGSLDQALRQGAVPWQALVGTAVQLGVFTVIVLKFAQKRSIQTVSR